MRGAQGWGIRSVAWLLPVIVSACAGVQRDASLPINDPNERTNRAIFAANQAVLHPVSQVVKAVTPGPIHDRLHDLNANLAEPRIFANDILQLRYGAAVKTVGRFITNSSVGIGGLFDVASIGGLPRQSGDFGQTLFVWGFTEGPYMVRPYFGPSTLRDSIGSGVDLVGDPVGWALSARFGLAASLGTGALDASVRLSELKEAEDVSIDFYSFLRSAYYQTRRAELREAIGLPPLVESPATATSPSR
ncbi:phospholipid-binding lipoprotein MlaA [Rhizobiales bacterium GAS188]|nr:phospholipid-binding lipoprotein MlaA [Rhizobiales bacterium GAS188]